MSMAMAFVRRDLRVAWSYRFNFFLQHLSVLGTLVTMRFMADVVGSSSASLAPYGSDYFSFALIGMAIQLMALPAATTFRDAVRNAQLTGTFEAMLATRGHPALMILSSGIYALGMMLVRLIVIVLVVGIVLGAHLRLENLAEVILVLAMTMGAFSAFGLLSTAFTIATKQTEPFTMLILSLSGVVSGVLYPTSVLPHWLAAVAPFLPMTHALELTRGLFIQGASVGSLAGSFIALAAFTLLLPISVVVLMVAVTWAKRTGSLAHY